jgi:beta-lactamase regulating signal transducer with metallopeptidase domain
MSELFLTVLNMSLTASYVILFVILVRLLLKKAPKVISYALWGVVAFRLIIPFSFESMFSLMPQNTNPVPIPHDIIYQQSPQINSGIEVVDSFVSQSLPAPTIGASVNPLQIFVVIAAYIWVFCIIALLIYSLVSILILKRRLKSAQLVEKDIFEAKNLKTPFVLGLFRPKIYIPSGLSEEEKSYIILHEQTHIRRFDHLVKMVAFLILCAHWFNPLVWAAFLLMSADMEMSCDERVLKEMGGKIKQAYSTSLLSLATGRHLINGSPLAFGEGNIKGRIKNILNFKKPAAWVIAVSVVLVVTLSIGFAANKADPNNSSDWDIYDFPSYLYDRVTFNTETVVYPTSFEAINAVLTNTEMESGLTCGKAFTLVKQVEGVWRVVPFEGIGFDDIAINLPVGVSETYNLTPNMISVKLGTGNYRIITDVWYTNEREPVVRTVWADFTIAAPDSTGWQDVRIGIMRDEVHKIMGEPVGMLSGLFGDIYKLDDGSNIIIYYDAESKVYRIKLTEPPVDTSSSTTKTPSEDMELITKADLDRNGHEDSIYLDKTQIESTHDITLRVLDSSGYEIWSESANTSHAGWSSLFLFEKDGEYYLLRYNPTMYQGYCTYVYTFFTLENGKEKVYHTNTLEFDINGTKELDVPKMISFADEVNALLSKSILLMSTKDGAYSFGPSAEPFYERYSWLDEMPKLYAVGDGLEMRLKKYSDYVVSNRRISEGKVFIVTESEVVSAKEAAISYYENTDFKGRVTDIVQIKDSSEFESAVISYKIKDVVVAFYVTMSDNAKRIIVLTREKGGDWEVINEGV